MENHPRRSLAETTGPEHFAAVAYRALPRLEEMTMDHSAPDTIGSEWSLTLTGNLGVLGEHYEMNGLDEELARLRLAHWRRRRPDVHAVLRRRDRQIYVGDWEQVTA